MRSALIFIGAISVAGCADQAVGQAAAQPPGPSAASLLVSLPYRADGRLLMVEASINGGPARWFMVDSGASHTVIDPRLQRELGLPILQDGQTTGAGAGTVALQHVGPARMRLGGFEIGLSDPWVIDLSGVPIDPETRGLVGAEVFKSHVVRLDPLRRRFEIFDPARFRPDPGSTAIPLIVEGDKLLVELTLDVRPGLSVTERIRIDTGAEELVNHPIVEQAVERRQSVQGNGLGSNFVAWSGRMQAVHIGPFTIRDVWGPGSPGPTLGMEILRRFIVTFDAPHGRLHLTPTPALDEPVPPPAG